MANYQRGTRIQSVVDFRTTYFDQSESTRFQDATQDICNRVKRSPSELANIVLEYVSTAPHPEPNLRDLVDVMQRINHTYNLGLGRDDNILYEAVKGLPFFSNGRLGYTFNRKRKGENRGVFLFSF